MERAKKFIVHDFINDLDELNFRLIQLKTKLANNLDKDSDSKLLDVVKDIEIDYSFLELHRILTKEYDFKFNDLITKD